MSKPYYILQKDCLDAKKGDEYYTETDSPEDGYVNRNRNTVVEYIERAYVENNPKWFLPKEEQQPKEPHPHENNYKDMIFQRTVQNPYSNEGQSHCAYEKGFEECWEHFFKPKEQDALKAFQPVGMNLNQFVISLSKDLPPEKYEPIKRVIEFILNGSDYTKDFEQMLKTGKLIQ